MPKCHRARGGYQTALAIVCLGIVPLTAGAQGTVPSCQARGSWEFLSSRPSPLDSVMFTLDGQVVKLCYSRPSARGRIVFDKLVEFGKLWRTGANEPTMLHLPVTADVAGVWLPPGAYVITTVPGPNEWSIILSTTDATEPARMFETLVRVGRGIAKVEVLDTHVEKLTIRPVQDSVSTHLVLEWEKTRVRLPIRRMP